MYFKIRKGVTRIVLLFGPFAIKIPNFTFSQQNFISGCLANHNERLFCKQWKGSNYKSKVAVTYFSSWFGLLNIQERVNEIPKSYPLDIDILRMQFEKISADIKRENCGFRKAKFGSSTINQLVCLDYG